MGDGEWGMGNGEWGEEGDPTNPLGHSSMSAR